MKKAENTIVGISIGDLNGIGSEVILKTFEDSRMLEFCTPVIFANVKILSFVKKTFESTSALHGIDTLDQMVLGKINVLNVWRDTFDINFGANDEMAGNVRLARLCSHGANSPHHSPPQEKPKRILIRSTPPRVTALSHLHGNLRTR